MDFILEIFDGEGDSTLRTFKTLRGATSAGCRALKTTGYLHADKREGESGSRRHTVAEWKDRGRVLARVWT